MLAVKSGSNTIHFDSEYVMSSLATSVVLSMLGRVAFSVAGPSPCVVQNINRIHRGWHFLIFSSHSEVP